jgi:hypothetical protein
MVVMEMADEMVEKKEGPEITGKKFELTKEDKPYRWEASR